MKYIIIGVIVFIILIAARKLVLALLGGIFKIIGAILKYCWALILIALIVWAVIHLGIPKTIIIIGILLAILFILGVIGTLVEINEGKTLKRYLKSNCQKLGRMNEETWKKQLPDFVEKMDYASFKEITETFTKDMEEKYFDNNTLAWFQPTLNYAFQNRITDINLLTNIPNENLKFTHYTPNIELISRAAKKVAARNEDELNNHLKTNCEKCGYMDTESWNKLLPNFAGKIYSKPFEQITEAFATSIQNNHLSSKDDYSWFEPTLYYLLYNRIADVSDLEQAPNSNLKYTHGTSDKELIYAAIEYYSSTFIFNGKRWIEKHPVENEQLIREQLNLTKAESIPEYYKTFYKVCDQYPKIENKNSEGVTIPENIMESEEMTLDEFNNM